MGRECQREVHHKWGSLVTGEQPSGDGACYMLQYPRLGGQVRSIEMECGKGALKRGKS